MPKHYLVNINRGYRWYNFIPKNNQGLSLYLCRCKWRPEAQAQILHNNINADTPLYAYLDPQAEPNAGIYQYLASEGGEFKGFSASGY